MSIGIVERALNSLGKGFDLTSDFKLKYCKGKERLVLLNETHRKDINLPGFGPIKDVSIDVKCDKGDRTRYQSDILEFNQVFFFPFFLFVLFNCVNSIYLHLHHHLLLPLCRCQSFSTRRTQFRGKFHQGISTPCLTWRATHGRRMQPIQSIWDSTDILSLSLIFILIAILSFSLMKFVMLFLPPGIPVLFQGNVS